MHRTTPRDNFLDCLKQVLLLDGFEAFSRSSNFDKPVVCLREKQGMLVNNEHSSLWYSRVSIFLNYQFGIGEKKLCNGDRSAFKVTQTNPSPECKGNGTDCYGG